MKKVIALFSILAFIFATPALAVPATPEECEGMTFDNVIVQENYGQSVTGTNQRDLIFLAGGSSVDARGGNDCVVGSISADSIRGGTGNDVIVSVGWGDSVKGGDGNDTIYGDEGGASLQGEGGNDEITTDGWGDALNGGTGTDTCSGNASSSIKSCEL